MQLTWMGHATFLCEASDGTRLVIDPYVSGSFDGAIAYAPVDEAADTVLITHDHPDHNGASEVRGNPEVITKPRRAQAGGVMITGIPVFHDPSGGAERGDNTIIVLEDSDLRLVHLGDLGHELETATIEQIGRVDVLLTPVGGMFTIDPQEAARTVDALSPRVVIPMHYKTPKCGFDLASVDEFTRTQSDVERTGMAQVSFDAGSLPATRKTVVLEPAR